MSKLAEFCIAIGDIPNETDAAAVRIKSRDFFWFSPILRNELQGKTADLVVRPRNKRELVRIAAAAAVNRIPLTVRGGGTGYRGQSVPLAGGVLVDMSEISGILWQREGAVRVEAGARFLEVDRALRPFGWELQQHPSSRKTATIGGYIAGGKNGCGSCHWGNIADPGAVLAVEVVTVEEEPRILQLRGADVAKVLQAGGVNGIITEVELPLAPAGVWAERIFAFPDLSAAAMFGQELIEAKTIGRKLVSVHDARIAPMMRGPAELVPEGHAMAIVMIAEQHADTVERLAGTFGGEVAFARGAHEADNAVFRAIGAIRPVYEYTWNHTTLHALRVEPGLTFLELEFSLSRNPILLDVLQNVFGEGLMMHLEFVQDRHGIGCVALPLLRYAGRKRLYAVIERLRGLGVTVRDPHSYLLDETTWLERGQRHASFKADVDPFGLMNPGKLDVVPDASELELQPIAVAV